MRNKILVIIIIVASFLRLFGLDQVPVSMFGDELDVGYQAYSILKTGQDYSGNPWPLHFQSLAEYRTPLYLYSAVPTVALFGISPLGVRLPAAIFGILSIWAFYLLVKRITKNENLSLIAAFLLTISPWHIQYSRAGFEVTQLLFFLVIGLYAFYKSFDNPKYLVVSSVSLALTPWIYSTAKFFLPFLLLFMAIVYLKKITKFNKKYFVVSLVAFFVIAAPAAYSTIFGGGAARFGYISVFSDPVVEPEVGTARAIDAYSRGEVGTGLNPTLFDKLLHNKFLFWFNNIERNYLQSLSTDFLFNEGDPNLRHSIQGIGQFYRIELIPLVLGLIYFFTSKNSRKTKLFIAFWILGGVVPSAITRDGGMHATRLILILPPLIFLVAYGLYSGMSLLPKKLRAVAVSCYMLVLTLSFVFYQHNFWVHNKVASERWWHAGWSEAIQSIKSIEKDYSKVIITSYDEPPWIFFAAHYMYDPAKWHKGYPMQKRQIDGFGDISYIDKYYFGSPNGLGLYDWGKILDDKSIYLASVKEVKVNLIMEPERTPSDLNLVKSIAYPSGEPVFYLFSKK